MSTLVVGLGNTDRGDDAIGIVVARRVAALAAPDVRVVETDDPASLLDVWDGSDRVVVVDAMASRRAAGTTVAIDVSDAGLPTGDWAAGGTHALGLAAVVELGRALGRLPRHLVVVGVEAAAAGRAPGLTPAIAAATDDAVGLVLDSLGAGEP